MSHAFLLASLGLLALPGASWVFSPACTVQSRLMILNTMHLNAAENLKQINQCSKMLLKDINILLLYDSF